jgi:integrase
MAHVEDRWIDATGEKTARHGKGMRYRARYTGPDGEEHSKSFPDHQKRAAEKYGNDQETDVRRGSWLDPDAGKITLRKFTETVYMPGLASNPTTRERIEYQFRLHICPVLGSKPLGYLAAHPSVIQQWVKGLTMAPSSARVVLSVLSGILAIACDDGLISRNPCHNGKVRAPKPDQRKVIPWEQGRVTAVQGALIPRYRGMIPCGGRLGMRQGEVFGFSPADVDWLRGEVSIRRQVKIIGRRMCFAPPKGGHERGLPLPETAKLPLSAHLAEFPAADVTLPWGEPGGKLVTVPLMFTTARGKAVRRSDFDSNHWLPALEAAGVERDRRNGFHALRHLFASVLLHRGVDIGTVAEYLGHHDPGFTLRTYCHLIPESGAKMRDAIDAEAREELDGPETAQDAGADG